MATKPPSKRAAPPAQRRRRRSDAQQNLELILEAAAAELRDHPDASIDDIARAAGFSRQTVYAHFSSRDALLAAVVERAASEVSAAFQSVGVDDEHPVAELVRLLDLAWETSARYPFLWHLPEVSAAEDTDRHAPFLARLESLIVRAQQSGQLDPELPPGWLLAAALALGRAAETEVKEGRMTIPDATRNLRASLLRLLGIESPPPV